MLLRVVVPPAAEPVTLDEAKAHVRYTGTGEDDLIAMQLAAAREQCELVARRAFVTQTLETWLWGWPGGRMLQLPRPPLQSVVGITYIDADGTEQTMPEGDYVVYAAQTPGLLTVASGAAWPSATLQPGPSIGVQFVAGYGDPEAVPARYKQAVLMLFATWFANREHVTVGAVAREMPDAVRALLLTDRGWL